MEKTKKVIGMFQNRTVVLFRFVPLRKVRGAGCKGGAFLRGFTMDFGPCTFYLEPSFLTSVSYRYTFVWHLWGDGLVWLPEFDSKIRVHVWPLQRHEYQWNSKSEYRIPKQTQISNVLMIKTQTHSLSCSYLLFGSFELWSLDIVSDFVLRI